MNKSETLKCPYCNYKTSSDRKGKCLGSLLGHIKRTHDISEPQFKKTNLIDIEYWEDKKSYMAENSKRRLRDPKTIEKKNEQLRKKIGDEKYYELPECKICGFRGKQLYKHVFNIHEISVDDYKHKYEGITETKEYLTYLSESRTGENNPMYNNGTSENSPWAVEFYLKKGYSQEESIKLKKEFITRVSESKNADVEPTRIEYYMKKYNIDKEEATDMLNKRQATNSIENIAIRNNISHSEAKVIRDQITEKWLSTLNNKSPEEKQNILRKKLSGSNSISSTSIQFFNKLINDIDINSNEVLMNQDELILYKSKDNRRYRAYDFTYKNKIIEYNGDRTHANPLFYKHDDVPHKHMVRFNQEKTAKEIWDYDADKIKLAEENGYEVLVIWHSDVKKNIYRELRRCKEFLSECNHH